MTDHASRAHAPRTGQGSRAGHRTRAGHDAILVTGATGNTGSRIVRRLTALGHPVRAAARRAPELPGAQAVRFDWYDPATHHAALRGAARIYLVPPVGATDPSAVMLPFLEGARAAGVRRAVLLSSSGIPAGGPMVGRVHAALPGLFEEWAVLRPSWFMQNFTDRHLHAESIRTHGVIRSATGAGRVGFIDADDIAAVAVRALTDEPPPPAHDLVLTGPQALSYDDIAATLTTVTGRPVHHRPLAYEELRDHLAAGIPAEFAALLAGLDRAIAGGAEDRVTDTVERLTGRPPRSFRAFAEEHGRAAGNAEAGP
ncbi:NAD(P)H-binding protein [Streptomyces decoyicus]|uniref:NAD(P)H-binding protein n=1 Tax=Streptomyces decoyicus TaxID=249567 RepID=UPI00099C26E9|nr:NAD(P)H-binding protein [Streptomyces decoyicus]QZY17290.1 NAD(P)H-binding protein [Streptomyces decoyicus]